MVCCPVDPTGPGTTCFKLNMEITGKTNEYLLLETLHADYTGQLESPRSQALSILWPLDDQTILTIDTVRHQPEPHQLLFLTEFHRVKVEQLGQVRLLRFNRAFYCIIDHDTEVGCKGILFFGAENLPTVRIPKAEQRKFELLWEVFLTEMQSSDHLQVAMLQMLLKRMLILSTRLHKEQHQAEAMGQGQLDVIRAFNFLVEKHFRQKHKVADYAAMLYKSPKTLSNYFARYNQETPLHMIQHRILLEAHRLLAHSTLPVNEIADQLGFADVQAFSRFFRRKEGCAPSLYREKTQTAGRNANSAGNSA